MKYIAKFWKSYNLDKAFFFVFYMAMCFPFVGNFHQTDTQPWALLLAIMYVVARTLYTKTRENNFYTNALLLFLGSGVLIGIFSMKHFYDYTALMRSGANYASVFFITVGVYYMLKAQEGLKDSWVKLAIFVWLFVGLVQKYMNGSFCRNILAASRTDSTRGVISLGSEPSFYGYMCVFFILFAIEFKRFRWFYVGLLIYQIVFLASSSVSLVYLCVFLFMWFVENLCKRNRIALLCIPLAVAGFFIARQIIPNSFQTSRIMELIRKLLYRPNEVIADPSIVQRFDSIRTSVLTFMDNMGMPGGLSSVRITSGYGAMLVELGFVAVFGIVLFAMLMAESRFPFVVAAGMTIIMFSGIQLACPMFSFYLGLCLYKKQKRIEEGEEKYV